MKKMLLLSLLIAIAIQVNGQQLSDFENQHEKLTQESELLRKNNQGTHRDLLKLDSTYRYDDLEDNLQRKWIYHDYNFANNYASYDDFDYEGNMEWTPNFVRNREFNTDGSVSSYLSQRYVDEEWINSSKAIFEYNDSGYETLEDREGWDNDLQEWVPFIRFMRTYNADNILLTISQYGRDFTTGELELRYTNTYTNVDNVITEWLTENYNDGALYATSKTEVYLDTENERDSTYTYDWNEVSSSWDLVSRYVYPEDINASIRHYQTDQYIATTNSWDPQFLSVYTDYADIDETQYWDRMRSDEGESEFYLDSRLEYFWSNNPLDVSLPIDGGIELLMPNPFEGNLEIRVNQVKENTVIVVYDVNGNTMFSKGVSQSDSFSINKILPNGNYFVNVIQAGEIVETRQIVKVR